ncbi:MAG TPA: FxSxx-COOH system tetratricopeptide repeat protein, partial [Ktedonobacteraceae bacterium]
MNSVGTDPETGVDLKGGPAKMPEKNKRALLIEAVIASGLIVIGIPASQPLLTLAASVGGNWAYSLAERAFQHWRERWFTDDGVLNHDVAKALCYAFVDAVRQVEHDWKQHHRYQHLHHRSPEQAQLTLDALRILREDGANLFQQPNQLTQIIQQEQQNRILSLLYQDESKANEYLKSVLADFLYGHDDEFVTFITEQLGPQWILRFLEILKASNEEGTRAWRACQLLWQKSLMLGIDQIERTTAETADTVRWLKEWAQQLKNQAPTQRDSTGQDALETILHSVHAQLDEMQQTLNKTYDTALDIKATLEQVYQKVAPAEIAPTAVWNVPYQRNLFFTGRDELLKQLHDNLTNRKAVALTQAISGLGGVGKTQTALEYAYRYQDDYQYVLWVNAASRETLNSSFLELARLLNLSEKNEPNQNITIQAMKRWLEQHDHWLLLVDSADELSLANDFLPTGGKGHILLTTRTQAPGPPARKIDVEVMDKDEGMLFLLRRAGVLERDAPLSQSLETDRVAADAIVEEMGRLPLALDQAGAYIEETHCGVSGYLESYRKRQAELLNRRGGTGKEHPEPVATTWSLSFQRVEEHNPMATDLLRVCAFLAPDAISVEIFVTGASELGPHIKPLTTDATRINEAIGVLQRYSLVKRDPQEPILSIHRLVQAVQKESMSEQMQREWAERTVRAVNLAFPSFADVTDVMLWKECEPLLPHAQVCKALIEQWNFAFPEAGRLLYETGRYLFDRAQYAQAELLYELALSIREQAQSTGHYDTARTLHALAWLYKDQGQYEQKRTELLDEALKIRKHVSRILYELAWVYKDQGRSKEAEPLFEAVLVLNVRKEIAGDERAETASALHALAQLYQDQGRYEQAEPLFEEALEARKQALEPQHLQVADSLHALAWLYQIQGRYEEAKTLYQRAWAIREQVRGPWHPLTAETLRAIGQLYQDQGRYEEAELRFTQALEARKQVLGPQHPQVADSLHALAWLYQIQGRYQKAEPLFEEALAIREQVL